MINWVVMDEVYADYLRNSGDNRIPNVNYGPSKHKPFFGPLFEVGSLVYVTQVSHPKPRHVQLKQAPDFIKVFDKNSDQFLCVVNLNYMFPIPKSMLEYQNYSCMDKYRAFKDIKEKNNYIALQKKIMSNLRCLNVEQKAKALYYRKKNYPDDFISKRCIDFENLEKLALSYKKP